MARPGFSETTYGFALTYNLVDAVPGVTGLPTFPNTALEGRAGGGFDVRVPRRSQPLFLQFKIPEVLVRDSRLRPPHFPVPYYRLLLRSGQPDQHRMLLDHEARGRLVFYAAPRFHSTDDLNRHVTARRVLHRSAFFRPGDIGPLDDEPHHVAYHDGDRRDWWVFSEPSPREVDVSGEGFIREVHRWLEDAESRPIADLVGEVWEELRELAEFEGEVGFGWPMPSAAFEEDRDPTWSLLRRAGHLSQIVLGAHLLVLTNPMPNEVVA